MLSRDLKELIPGVKGFASSNLRYMTKFYLLYTEKLPQAVGNSEQPNFPQVVGNLDYEDLFGVPWGHHRVIIDRCKGDSAKASFFVRKTIQNNWANMQLGHLRNL